MSKSQQLLMEALYGRNIWEGFIPLRTTDDVEGWNGDHPSLQRLARSNGEKTAIDVGVWKGQSTITMAQAIRETGLDGCVIAVDTFLGSAKYWGRTEPPLLERSNAMPNVFQTFMSNVCNAGLQDYVIPLPQTSVAAALILKNLRITANVIHIDAEHQYDEVRRDIEEYWNILEMGGYMIGDDYEERFSGVIRAVGEFSAQHSLPLAVETPKWILRKIS
ncbi:hypothetical protein ACVIGB_008474 [Bradyrhizobium sp. USDA 4341]